jgi:hypothetical protein
MLKMTTRFVLAGLVAAQIGGCASYKQGAFPTFDQESGAKEETVEIRVGSEVEIVMITGEKTSGEVVRISENELVVGRAGNYGFEENTIDRQDIVRVEVRKETGVATVAATTVGVLVIAFVALGVLFGLTGGVNMS